MESQLIYRFCLEKAGIGIDADMEIITRLEKLCALARRN